MIRTSGVKFVWTTSYVIHCLLVLGPMHTWRFVRVCDRVRHAENLSCIYEAKLPSFPFLISHTLELPPTLADTYAYDIYFKQREELRRTLPTSPAPPLRLKALHRTHIYDSI